MPPHLGLDTLLSTPSAPWHGIVYLVSGAAAHESASFEFWPGGFYFSPFFFPCLLVAVDLSLNVVGVASAAAEHLQEGLLGQLLQVRQGSELVATLQESLQVDMKISALLAFEGTVYGIHAAKDPTHGCCVAAKRIDARIL